MGFLCLAQAALVAFSYVASAQDAEQPDPEQQALAEHLERYWAYGRSPPVYPTPEMTGTSGWEEAFEYARDLVSQMTNDEKNNITYGFASTTNGCSGNIPGNARLGWPGLCLQDNGNAVRGTDGVNGGPSGLSIGASWNKDLALRRAQFLGAEFRAKGANVALGPMVGPIGRVAEAGRNWEGFSNDPYLAGSLVYETIIGMQESVIACVKHFIANEQETDRIPPSLIPNSFNQSTSSNIDDKTMHELYMWPFADAFLAGAGAVMCSYQQINGSYGCQNSKALNGLLKEELGFQGFVVSDWGAQHAGVATADAGMDMAMPDSPYWENGNLTLMVSNGSLSQSRLDDMAIRIIAPWYRFARFEEPGRGIPFSLAEPHEFVDARDPASKDIWLEAAIEGHVLVKNTNNALPLQTPRIISLFGYDGQAPAINSPTPVDGLGFDKWTFGLTNTEEILGFGAFNSSYLIEVFLSSAGANPAVPGIAVNGTLWTGGGSGATTPAFSMLRGLPLINTSSTAYIDAPADAFIRKAREDGTYVHWNFHDQDPAVNAASEACIVFINALASEGWDRPNIEDQYSDTLVENVARQCSNTHVVIHNAGVRMVSRFVDNPNITSIIYAHVPGQDSGQALVDIMYGTVSPSGRMPYTVGRRQSDYGQLLSPADPDEGTLWYPQSNFTEGVYIDYKHFIAQNITPQYEFGYGLTYSSFDYADIEVQMAGNVSSPRYMNATGAEGGDPELWESLATVSCTVTNTGEVEAAEVAQLYVHIPGGPQKQLRGYSKDKLAAGESYTATFALTKRDLSTWDVVSQSWLLQSGSYQLYVGKSVLDIQLEGSIDL